MFFPNSWYLTIRRQARGFYQLIVGEGQRLEPTIKDDTEKPRASTLIVLAYLSDRSIIIFHKVWYICTMMHAKSRVLGVVISFWIENQSKTQLFCDNFVLFTYVT